MMYCFTCNIKHGISTIHVITLGLCTENAVTQHPDTYNNNNNSSQCIWVSFVGQVFTAILTQAG